MSLASSARIAWFATAGAETERDRPAPAISLPPPESVEAVRGRGQVTIDWSPIEGAIGYLVHRGPASLRIRGLRVGPYELRHHRVDALHSNIVRTWEGLGKPDWPDSDDWARLQAADRLEALDPPRKITADGGHLELEFGLPMPAMSLIELVPG